MPNSKILIGTRGSLLALTQATQTMNKLTELTGRKFELVPIKTEGDIKTDKPLWQMDGNNFFTKELDIALFENKVDMVIHSYKDLGSERPDHCELAAVTKRTYAHDILLITKETISKLNNMDEFVVGTSSPRRIENLESSLDRCLPKTNGTIKVTTKMLRGNVNTRVEKLIRGDYHAICLALPGLERLCLSDKSREELQGIIGDKLNFMILSQSQFPSAASQGALAIEISKEGAKASEMRKIVKTIHDQVTSEEIAIERKLFNEYGGGCHLAVGINAKKIASGEFVISEKGITYEKEMVLKRAITSKDTKQINGQYDQIFIGLPTGKLSPFPKGICGDELLKKSPNESNDSKLKGNFLVSSNYSVNNLDKIFGEGTVWTAGAKTLKSVAEKGYWVNGTSDSLGEDEISSLISSKLLSLINPKIKESNWYILTNKDSKSNIGKVIESYTRKIVEVTQEFKDKLNNCSYFYWTSFFQYQSYAEAFPDSVLNKSAIHSCGIGKTLKEFQKNGIDVNVHLSPREFISKVKS